MGDGKIVAIGVSDFSSELKDLQGIRDKIIEIRGKYDPSLVVREIGFLNNATKCNDLSSETRDLIFKELRKKKLIREILEACE